MLRLLKYLASWLGFGISKARFDWINSQGFLESKEWAALRYQALKNSKGRCVLCGRGAPEGARLNVDHIKPRRLFPALALSISNLQVLCSLCNRGKGNRADDWRRPARPDFGR